MASAHAQTPKQTTNLTGKWTGTMTRTAPDGRSQTIGFMFDLTQKGKVLTGTAGPALQGSGVFRTYPVLCSMRWQDGIARVVGTGMPRRSCRSLRST